MSFNRILLSTIIASLLVAPLAAQSKPQYEIYAIRYATLPGFPVSELVPGVDPARKDRHRHDRSGSSAATATTSSRLRFLSDRSSSKHWHVNDFIKPPTP